MHLPTHLHCRTESENNANRDFWLLGFLVVVLKNLFTT